MEGGGLQPPRPRVFAFDFEPSFEAPEGRACFLLRAAAEGRLPGLRAVDFAALGKSRAVGEEASARRFIERLGAGALLPEMEALAVDGEVLSPAVFFLLAGALKERAAVMAAAAAAAAAVAAAAAAATSSSSPPPPPPPVAPPVAPVPLRELRVHSVRLGGWSALAAMLESGLCEQLATLDVSGQGALSVGRRSRLGPGGHQISPWSAWTASSPPSSVDEQPPHPAPALHHAVGPLNAALRLLEDSVGAGLSPLPTASGRAAHQACPALRRGAEALGAWLRRTRAPKLHAFSTNACAATFTPLADALAAPGVAPVLEELCLSHLRTQGLRELGRLLALGRLPRLRSLALYNASITDLHLSGFWRDVMRAQGLPGVEELVLYGPRWQREATLEEEEAHWGGGAAGGLNGPRVFVAGLRAGCFPRLRRLELFLEEAEEGWGGGGGAFLSEDEILLLLAGALAPVEAGGSGAPCGRTLEEVEVHRRASPGAIASLRRALPQARVVGVGGI